MDPCPPVTHRHGLLDGGALYQEPDTHILGHFHSRLRGRKGDKACSDSASGIPAPEGLGRDGWNSFLGHLVRRHFWAENWEAYLCLLRGLALEARIRP